MVLVKLCTAQRESPTFAVISDVGIRFAHLVTTFLPPFLFAKLLKFFQVSWGAWVNGDFQVLSHILDWTEASDRLHRWCHKWALKNLAWPLQDIEGFFWRHSCVASPLCFKLTCWQQVFPQGFFCIHVKLCLHKPHRACVSPNIAFSVMAKKLTV